MPEIIKTAEEGPGVGALTITRPGAFNYNYAVTGGAAAAGQAKQPPGNLGSLAVNVVDNDGHDNSAFLGQLLPGDGIVVNGQVWIISAVSIASGVATFTVTPVASFPPLGLAQFTFVPKLTIDKFPAFTPIVPPPLFGVGGGPPPTFPPPTPPPIGAIPPGVLVGPAIAPAAVPPSVAGFPLIQFKTGSATSPTAASVFPQFTTTFPKPTIVVDGNNFAVANAGHIPPWTQPPPAQTASTAPIVLDGWGPGVPPGAPTAPGGDGRFPRTVAFEGMMVTGEDVTTTTWKPEPEPVEPEPEPEPEPERKPHRRRR